MKKVNRDELIKWLDKFFSFVDTSESFNGSNGGVWLSGEECESTYSGMRIYDYYSESSMYELGVLNKFEEVLQKKGWFSEWYDSGTVMIWEI